VAKATIGFTGTTAEGFFERLLSAGVKKIVDVRLCILRRASRAHAR
jgi:hypothetical protein